MSCLQYPDIAIYSEVIVGTPWNITREVFDNAVLEAARDVGAEIMTQTRVSDFEFNGGVTVKTSKGNFKSKMVIGATGPADKLADMVREKREQYEKDITIVFGCGGERDKGKRAKMGKIVDKLCHKIFVTDDNPRGEILPSPVMTTLFDKIIQRDC